jgi:hypothetical protein
MNIMKKKKETGSVDSVPLDRAPGVTRELDCGDPTNRSVLLLAKALVHLQQTL